MRRKENWPELLIAFIDERERQPFAWGSNDCCLFASDAIKVMTDIDPADKIFRGKYKTAVGAMRMVAKKGGVEAIAESICAKHGFQPIEVPFAQRGDLVLLDHNDEPVLGICVRHLAAFVTNEGLTFIPVAQCRRAWRIL